MKNNREIPFMVDVFSGIIKKEYIDISMSEKIKNHIKQRSKVFLEIEESSDKNFHAFEKLRFLYDNLLSCDEIITPNFFCFGNTLINDKEETSKILSDFKIKMTSCIAFSLCDRLSYRKYYIVIFSNTILLFMDPCNKPVKFLCALKQTAFNVSFKTETIEKTVAVHETSREPIEYYEKYNPVPDSKILNCNWEVTNRDGSRSFRGGLKPENNPLHFYLEYGVVTLTICSTSLEYGFSNSDLAKIFAEEYSKYFDNQKSITVDNGLKQEELYRDALNIVKKLHKESLWEKYKSLSPFMQVFLFVLLIFGAFFIIGVVTILVGDLAIALM